MKEQKFFVRNYSACWKFLNESRWHVVFALGIFMLIFLVGFVFPIFFREQMFSLLREMVVLFEGKEAFEMIVLIFLNNMKASLFSIVLGISFGILTLVTLVYNAYLVGFVSRLFADIEGIGVLWQLAPHGIFELPAIILSMGFGLKIGTDLFRKDVWKILKHNFKESMRFFAFVIFPLLLVAGIIEGLLIVFLS